MNLMWSGVVKAIRTTGQSLDNIGKAFEVCPYEDRLLASTRAVKFKNHKPQVNASFVASSATIIGNVEIGSKSSVWYGAVIRGDVNSITIGDNVTIGDRVMVHVNGHSSKNPTTVRLGNNIIVEAGAILNACTLEDNTYIGSGSQILDGAVIQTNSIIAPGSIVCPGKIIPSCQLWSGSPAVYSRNLTDIEIQSITKKCMENADLSIIYAQESDKKWEEIEEDEYVFEQTSGRNPDYYKRLTPEEMSHKLGEVDNHRAPGRIFDSNLSGKSIDEGEFNLDTSMRSTRSTNNIPAGDAVKEIASSSSTAALPVGSSSTATKP